MVGQPDLHVKNADLGEVSGVTLVHEGMGIVREFGKDFISLKIVDGDLFQGFNEGSGNGKFGTLVQKPLVISEKMLDIQ
ncbi:hypothetical protein N4849_14040, partial [Enterococcus faecalis]|nr:hypothetical protein [Enterococcus faecalis]